MRRTDELDVEAFKIRVMRLARDRGVDSAIVVAALADVLGVTAAILDEHAGHQPFELRMSSFIERAKATYARVSASRARARVIAR